VVKGDALRVLELERVRPAVVQLSLQAPAHEVHVLLSRLTAFDQTGPATVVNRPPPLVTKEAGRSFLVALGQWLVESERADKTTRGEQHPELYLVLKLD